MTVIKLPTKTGILFSNHLLHFHVQKFWVKDEELVIQVSPFRFQPIPNLKRERERGREREREREGEIQTDRDRQRERERERERESE